MEDVQLNNLWICYQAAKGNSNKNDKEVFKEVIKNFLISEKAPVDEVPCSVGLEGLFIRMLDLSDQFEEFCCKESDDDFMRGQYDGKSLAYSDCANFLRELIEKAA